MNFSSRLRRSLLSNPFRLLPVSFAAMIGIGTMLLLLPQATVSGRKTTVLDALFTATSAVCVTGLSVVDTATHWTGFGKAIIMFLIQIGGLGIVTVVSIGILLVADRIGLSHTRILAADLRTDSYSSVSKLVRNIVLTTLAFEAIFAVLLAARFFFAHDYGFQTAAVHGVFHSVSAWNNAGFALYTDSFIGFANDWFLSIAICLAVIFGGIGFPVLQSLAVHKLKWRMWPMHTKLMISATAVLLVLGTALFLAFEWSNPRTLGALPESARLHSAFFHSAQTRTAGFNSVDTAALNEESLLVSTILMFIGGGSASTAGGIKVTTFALLAFVIWAEIRGDRDVNMFGRRISEDSQRQALTVALVGVGVLAASTLALMVLGETGLTAAAFEAVSALSTVGLSTGVTTAEGSPTRIVLIMLMFIGRLGPVVLVAAIVLRSRPNLFRFPSERPLIG
ncbi:MAG: TrkH family potassium uptake protein [Ilumatobacteraceae bacterium]